MTPSYRLAMLAYPLSYRRDHGAEIVATANEMADGAWSARQASALVVEGLRTRAHCATGSSPRQAWASGVALALALSQILTIGRFLVPLGPVVDPGYDIGPRAWVTVLVVVAPLLTLTITTRWPAVVAVAAPLMLWLVVIHAEYFGNRPMYVMSLVVDGTAVVLTAVVSILGDGRRALSPRWAAGLLMATISVGWAVSPLAMAEVTSMLTIVALPVLGVLLMGIDPRPLAAGSALWLITTMVGVSDLLWVAQRGSVAYVVQTLAIIFGSLLGLVVAWGAGRRALAVAR